MPASSMRPAPRSAETIPKSISKLTGRLRPGAGLRRVKVTPVRGHARAPDVLLARAQRLAVRAAALLRDARAAIRLGPVGRLLVGRRAAGVHVHRLARVVVRITRELALLHQRL